MSATSTDMREFIVQLEADLEHAPMGGGSRWDVEFQIAWMKEWFGIDDVYVTELYLDAKRTIRRERYWQFENACSCSLDEWDDYARQLHHDAAWSCA